MYVLISIKVEYYKCYLGGSASRAYSLKINQEIELIFNFQVLGMGEKWLGGDMNYPGGGFKVNLLKKELEEMVKASEASADRYS